MHVPAAAAAGTAGAAAVSLFSYNRQNFQFDAGLRFQRFTAARGFANAQTSMYREDVQGLAEMTVAKMDTWQTVCTLFLCVCAALSCAGRLGMHGAAPPGWLCALYSGNIFTSILLCGLALWLALHASLRAQCAMVSLLTRKVRLPIPSMAELDQARVFASSYEKQRVGDMFRVPFMRHPEYAPDIPDASSEEDEEKEAGKKPKSSSQSSSSAFDSTSRTTVPSWVRDEQVVDKLGGVPMEGPSLDKDAHETPEHFKMMAKAMEEWWQYDVYARITMLYGVMCFLFAVAYYSIGTSMSELRGFWISWSLPLIFIAAQALILRLDIFQKNGRKLLPHCEWLGHIAPYFAVCATTLEFRFWYSPTMVDLTWVMVFLSFFGHFMMALRMLDLAWPDLEQEQDMREEPTKQWWPSSWRVPSAFAKNLWVLAPPKKLETGQHCLLHEMDDLKKGGASITSCRRRRRGGGEDEAKNRAKSFANPQALLQLCEKMDRNFVHLFDASVWNELPERSQKQLHAYYSDYGAARADVDSLPDCGGDDVGVVDREKLNHLAETLAKIEDGVREVQHKSRAARSQTREGAYDTRSPFDKFTQRRLPNLPWKVSAVAILAVALQWFFMMVATVAEWRLGSQSLLKPPGEPPWIRDLKTRSWAPEKVHLSSNMTFPKDYALFNPRKALPPIVSDSEEEHNDGSMHSGEHGDQGGHESSGHSNGHEGTGHSSDQSHSGGNHGGHSGETAPQHGGLEDTGRRLAAAYSRRPDAALGELLKALPALEKLAGQIGSTSAVPSLQEPPPPATPTFLAPALKARSVSWPPFFEPRHLLCSGQQTAAALTPRGFGALVPAGAAVEAHPFSLEGLEAALVGGMWGADGLELVTEEGKLLHCPGHGPTDEGTWGCQAAGLHLPVPEGSRLLAAAVKGGIGRKAALLLEEFPGLVTMLVEEGGAWAPTGEVHLPPARGKGRPGLSFTDEELVIVMPGGEVHRRHVTTGKSSTQPAPAAAGSAEFRSACALASGGLARLAVAPQPGAVWTAHLLEAA